MAADERYTGDRISLLPYWLLFVVWAVGSVQSRHRGPDTKIAQNIFFLAAAAFTTLMIGLRFEVGGDWIPYTLMYDEIYFRSLIESWSVTDPGYASINWLAIQFGMGIGFVNTVCAALFMLGLIRLAQQQPNPPLAMLVAVPYLIIVVAMGYTRQAAAIGIVCFAISDASENNIIKTAFIIFIAAIFHKSAILMLPIVLIPILRRNFIAGAAGAIFFVGAFIALLSDSSDQMINNYVNSDYNSEGALIRVLMNILAGSAFLVFYKRMNIDDFQKSFWFYCSILALVSVIALQIASASSGIDRISLYLIPLQVVALSRLPYISKFRTQAMPSLLLAVVFYSFLVQFVWLNYAANAEFWLPYKALPYKAMYFGAAEEETTAQ